MQIYSAGVRAGAQKVGAADHSPPSLVLKMVMVVGGKLKRVVMRDKRGMRGLMVGREKEMWR